MFVPLLVKFNYENDKFYMGFADEQLVGNKEGINVGLERTI